MTRASSKRKASRDARPGPVSGEAADVGLEAVRSEIEQIRVAFEQARNDLDAAHAEVERLQSQLTGINSSLAWRWLAYLWRLREFVIPIKSRREVVWNTLKRWFLGRQRRRGQMTASLAAHGGAVVDPGRAYRRWIDVTEPDAAQLRQQRSISLAFARRPLVSLVTPVFEPDPSVLEDTIQSAVGQTYPHWELVLAVAGPHDESLLRRLEILTVEEPRIRVVQLASNSGISANTNQAIASTAGEFVLFLDHDDLLAPDALFEVIRIVNYDESAAVIYFDEDKIDANGRERYAPFFKPGPSKDLSLSINYLGRCAIRRDVLPKPEPLDPSIDGAQDWDLSLRIVEGGKTIRHVTKVLYHWRAIEGSAAGSATAKTWAFDAQRRCLVGYLERLGRVRPQVSHPEVGIVHATWDTRRPRASLIVLTKENTALLSKCVESIRALTSYDDYELIIVDTGSTSSTCAQLYERLSRDGKIRIAKWEGDFNYSAANNFGASLASGEVLVFLNNDVEAVSSHWLSELVQWAIIDEIGCVGARLVYPDGRMQHAGITVGLGGHGSHVFQGGPGGHAWTVFGSNVFYRNHLAFTGACLAVKRERFEEIGRFDEAYELCYSDIALCLQFAERGFRNVFNPFAVMMHHEGGSRARRFPPADVLRASIHMFPLVVAGDRFFNRNLSYRSLMPEISFADDPAARAALIREIAGMFGVEEAFESAIMGELRGETREWTVSRRLVEDRPSVPVGLRCPVRETEGGTEILLVTHDLSRSGAPMVCSFLVRYLTKVGAMITVVSPVDGRLREHLEELGARVVVDPVVLEAPYVLADILGGYDVVIASTILSWRVVIAARAASTKVLWFVHESHFGVDLLKNNEGASEAARSADRLIVPSGRTAELYRDFAGDNLRSLIYGFDLPDNLPVRSDAASKWFDVVVVGSIEYRKGQDIVVRALDLLPSSTIRRTRLTCIGRIIERDYYSSLQAGIRKDAQVSFLEELSHEETLERMCSASVLVCAARDETGPIVVMEALGLGVSVISTPVGAMPEVIVHESSGLIVREEDPESLAAALQRLFTNPDLNRQLAMEGSRTFDRLLSLDRYGHDVVNEICELLPGAFAGCSRGRSGGQNVNREDE